MIFGIGTDILEIERISDRHVDKILSTREQQFLPHSAVRRKEYIAGRFSAKEAVSKALGTGIGKQVGLRDIEVIPNSQGAPKVSLSEEVYRFFFGERKVKIHLSLSHHRTSVIAMVVIEDLSA